MPQGQQKHEFNEKLVKDASEKSFTQVPPYNEGQPCSETPGSVEHVRNKK